MQGIRKVHTKCQVLLLLITATISGCAGLSSAVQHYCGCSPAETGTQLGVSCKPGRTPHHSRNACRQTLYHTSQRYQYAFKILCKGCGCVNASLARNSCSSYLPLQVAMADVPGPPPDLSHQSAGVADTRVLAGVQLSTDALCQGFELLVRSTMPSCVGI